LSAETAGFTLIGKQVSYTNRGWASMIYRTLISTDILAVNLGSCAVIDCRFDLHAPDWGRDQYRAGHIPGAVYASLDQDLSGVKTGANGRHPLPTVDALAATFGRLGIDRDTQVVVYDQDTGLFASRLWWSLRYLGHDAVAVLDGGWTKWIREGRPTRSGDEAPAPAVFTPDPHPDWRVGVDEVAAQLGSQDVLLVDARGPERFEGRSEPVDRIAGHIPGATNHFYKWNVSPDGTMLAPQALREQFTNLLGGRRADQVVMYCGSGVSACHNLLAMEHAGLHGTKLYVGSWSEWSSDPARPIEKS
jgi:thiosulfate/3-mercaptopyruvate sulfurtransferase